jgi:hypothetical protein
MKEVFDISYAVHRIGEEGAHRKQKKNINRWTLNSRNDISDDDDEVNEITAKIKSTALKDKPTIKKKTFDLSMNNATLLGRRNNKIK